MSELKQSPLADLHREAGGRMVPFAGWEMPVMYQSILSEHQAVREAVGQFDISHMGQLFVEGEEAEEWLNKLLSNDVAALEDGQGQYTFLLNERGGVIDDLIIYRLSEGHYFLVVNAACLAEDLAWFGQHAVEGVTLRNESEGLAGIAVQGPNTVDVFSRVFGGRTLPSRNGIDELQLDGQIAWVCRTGYTGEDGFEFFCPASSAARWWEEFAEAGAAPCGLGARDSLRLEKCYPLNGSDLSPDRTPLEAGLGFFVKLDKEEFTGHEVLRRQKEDKPAERLVAIQCLKKGAPPRPGYAVLDSDGQPLGTLTSGVLSPCLGLGIGMAYLPASQAKVGQEVFIEARGKKMAAKVVKKPFVA
ncbi:glycine cleavage system aminomethyltransferase GcvT [Roseibacillus ishigakijimensis]|uniref:Aminomethyltransferase n=1 Tax=Roseibacillus ishigakijimensis TaxID=454146 RepID=A0A934VLD6_9BACT|nr:glycine cleavage system aminomethyltransferase GcvT [Roseibacillus ishigakijimensis]MBK1834574.1 glycine cleavage system aminomethyltransferase GcvT [Roseibacillus ishigakijimensis]